ncbi:MAG: glutathione peroxidase [Saprospiraceae bacterium]|jgi:glutathione peroxidase
MAPDSKNNVQSIHELTVVSISGDTIELSSFKGKKILFVNVASKCGFTPQYEGLQKLHEQYKDQLVIIGFPCNQFGDQEAGTKDEIQTFCSVNYGVEFLISEKIEVKGDNQHPIFSWLTEKKLNGSSSSTVKWNFQKYMVNEQGQFIDYWYSLTKPLSNKITKHLK